MNPTQTTLAMPVKARTVLIPLAAMRIVTGDDAESTVALIQAGAIRWVFDIGLGQRRQELRFWTREAIAPQTVAGWNLDQVIKSIIGTAATVNRGEIECQWVCSHNLVMDLIREQRLSLAAPGKISRASLVAFLKQAHAEAVKPSKHL